MNTIDIIKTEIRESQSPYFTDEDIAYYLTKNGNDIRATCYELLIIKSEDSSIAVSGLSTSDTSGYFKRLSAKFRKSNSGVLQ